MKEKKSKITSLIVLMVFCVFAVCILSVVLAGANVYERLVEKGQYRYEQRTAAQYITTRLRQADLSESVRIEDFEGKSALVLQEEIEGELYETYIYCYKGYIRELFITIGGKFVPEDGEKVLETEMLQFELNRSVLTVQFAFGDGTKQELTIYLRSGEGALQ